MRPTSSKPHVLEFVADGAPGGGTTHVGQILRAFKNSFELGLVTQRDSYLASLAQAEGIEVFGGNWFGAASIPGSLRALRRVLSGFKPDLVHCHGGRAALFFSLLRRNVPMLYTIHGVHYARRGVAGRVAGRWQHRRAIDSAAHVIYVCQYDRLLAERDRLVPDSKPHSVIYNGIAFPKLPGNVLGGVGADQRPIGFVGRLVTQKHPELFLDVVDRLPHRRAVMVGGGPLAEKLDGEIARRGLSHRVKRLGELDREATLAAIAEMDVLVMTSRWEGLPLLPLEAMHLAVPVVATAVGGVPEIIEHERTGILTSESPDALAAAVERLHCDRLLRGEITDAGRIDVRSRFSEQTMIEAVSDLYGRLSAATSNLEPAGDAACLSN